MEAAPIDILSLFLQVPVVGLFAWYMWKNNEMWQRFLTERNGKTEKALAAVADAMKEINISNRQLALEQEKIQQHMLRVLIKLTRTVGMEEDADELIHS